MKGMRKHLKEIKNTLKGLAREAENLSKAQAGAAMGDYDAAIRQSELTLDSVGRKGAEKARSSKRARGVQEEEEEEEDAAIRQSARSSKRARGCKEEEEEEEEQ